MWDGEARKAPDGHARENSECSGCPSLDLKPDTPSTRMNRHQQFRMEDWQAKIAVMPGLESTMWKEGGRPRKPLKTSLSLFSSSPFSYPVSSAAYLNEL